jgi:hypothetical protein
MDPFQRAAVEVGREADDDAIAHSVLNGGRLKHQDAGPCDRKLWFIPRPPDQFKPNAREERSPAPATS